MNFSIAASTFYWCLACGLLLLALLLSPRLRNILPASPLFWLTLGSVVVAGMILLPSKNHLLGDGLSHLGNVGRWFSPTEPLDIFLHQLVGQLTGSLLLSYHLIAGLAGLFYLFGLYLMSRLGDSPLERWVIIFSFLATATIQFYFGYVESYTLLNLFTLYFLYFAWRDLTRDRISKLPLLFFVLAVISHFAGMALLPGVLYLYRRNLGRGGLYLLGLLILAAVVAAYLVDITIITVPLFKTDFSAYTLFSKKHLLDLAQLLLLITPACWLALFARRFDRPVKFALVALGGALLFTLLVDPKIGAFRDWDLLSIYALPVCLLIALRAPRHLLTVAALVLIVALRIAPWLVFNSQPQLEYMKQVVADDLHYTEQYDNGQRLSSWGFLLSEMGDYQAAEAVFLERLRYKPNDLHVLNMLVRVEFKLGEFAAAHKHCLQALVFRPNDQDFRYRAMYTAFRAGNLDKVIELGANSPPGFWQGEHVQRLYAGVLSMQGKDREAIAEAKKVEIEDIDGYLPWILSHAAATIGDSLYARKMAIEAVELDSLNQEYQLWLDSLTALDNR
ncbi:MAG: hypothetical protein ABIJ61_02835 [bacterium]